MNTPHTKLGLIIAPFLILGLGALLLLWNLIIPDPGFMPRGSCGPWPGWLKWVYIGANAATALAYLHLAGSLISVWWTKGRDMPALSGIWAGFGAFILLCGCGHLLENVGAFWYPRYELFTLWQLATGVVSVWVAYDMHKSLPFYIQMPTQEQSAELLKSLKDQHKMLVKDYAQSQQEIHVLKNQLRGLKSVQGQLDINEPREQLTTIIQRLDDLVEEVETRLEELKLHEHV